MCESAQNWVVRFCRRDNETRSYWYDKNCNINCRLSSALRMDKETAVQFAKAVNEQCKDYKARAYRYETSVAKKEAELAAARAARKPDTLKSEEQVELEELRAENAKIKMQVSTLENFIQTITTNKEPETTTTTKAEEQK